MNTRNQIIILALAAILVTPRIPEAMEIRQEPYTFHMGVTRNSIWPTFVINERRRLRKFPVVSCHLPVAHFELGSSTLSPTVATGILSGLQKCGVIANIPLIVTGYTCELGPDQYNQALSLRRAKAVADLLRAHGFTVATVRGKGSKNPVTYDPLQFHLNRRVTVQVVKK